MLRADLHCHTNHSPDSGMAPQALVARCLQRGITCLAVTDHNTMRGALEVQRLAPFRVIVGEEIRTSAGEIIGLFLTEEIPRGLSPAATVARIKEQAGTVYVPHPFDAFRRSVLKRAALMEIVGEIDALEVFNARNLLPRHNEAARRFAAAYDLPAGAGSDAHTAFEVGGTYVEMPDFRTPQEFLQSLRRGRIVGRPSNPLVHLFTRWHKLRRALGARRAHPQT